MDREVRNLGHGKQSKIKSVSAPPVEHDGSNGDMQIYNGRLYIKDNNIWYSYSSDAKPVSDVVAFSVEMSDNQTLSSGITLAIVQFDISKIDTVSGFNTSDYKYHVQDGQAGYYLIGTDITTLTAAAVTTKIQIRQDLADGTTEEVWDAWLESHSDVQNSVDKSSIFSASAGDTFYVKAYVHTSSYDIKYSDKVNFYGFKIG